MCVSVYLLIRKYIFVCLPTVYPFACLCFWQDGMDYPSTLDLKLARFLGEACADLGWKTISLAGLLLIVNLYTFLFTCSGGLSTGPAWDCQCDKQESDAELPRKFTKAYWRSNMTYHYTNSLAQNLGPALRETCAMQVLHYPEALNKPAQNLSFKRMVLERPPLFLHLDNYSLVICYIAIEHGHRNSWFTQLQNGGSVHSYVNVYQRVWRDSAIEIVDFPIKNCHVQIENHNFKWENPLFRLGHVQ